METNRRDLFPGILYWLLVALLASLLGGRALEADGESGEEETLLQARNFTEWLGVLAGDPVGAFSTDTLERLWNEDHQHPSPPKMLMSATVALFGGGVGDRAAARWANLLWLFLAAWVLRHIACRYNPDSPAFLAPLLALASPNVLHQAGLATVYFAVAVLWWVAILLWLDRERVRGGRYLFCVLLGILIGIKTTALHLIPVLLILTLWEKKPIQWKKWLLPALAGAAAFVVVWPWLWPNPPVRLWEHVAAHAHPAPSDFPAVYSPDDVFFPLIPLLTLLFALPVHHAALAGWGLRREVGHPHIRRLLLLTVFVPLALFPIALSGEVETVRYLLPGLMAAGLLAGSALDRPFGRWLRDQDRAMGAALGLVLYLLLCSILSRANYMPNLLEFLWFLVLE